MEPVVVVGEVSCTKKVRGPALLPKVSVVQIEEKIPAKFHYGGTYPIITLPEEDR